MGCLPAFCVGLLVQERTPSYPGFVGRFDETAEPRDLCSVVAFQHVLHSFEAKRPNSVAEYYGLVRST